VCSEPRGLPPRSSPRSHHENTWSKGTPAQRRMATRAASGRIGSHQPG
jgi:hypothetical protein